MRAVLQCCGLTLATRLLTPCVQFVSDFASEEPPFGFNGLGELVYRRTYSRLKQDGEREQWFETVQRVSRRQHWP